MNRVPVIDLSECRDCDSCLAVSPGVFKRNEETGCIEVADLHAYPEEEVQEAIAVCPSGCIRWQET